MGNKPRDALKTTAADTGKETPPDPTVPVADGMNGPRSAAAVESELELIDWDVKVLVPPTRACQTLTVRFVEAGKRPVPAADDPQDSQD